MLMCKISKVEILYEEYSSTTIKFTSLNGDTDIIKIISSIHGLELEVRDRGVNSYKFINNTIDNNIIKVKGALAGVVCKIGNKGVRINLYENNEVLKTTDYRHYVITLGNFQITLLNRLGQRKCDKIIDIVSIENSK